MKKYIIVFLLSFVYIGCFAQTSKENDAFETIKTFLKEKDNYNVDVKNNKVAVSKDVDWKKQFYFFTGNDINLTNKKNRCVKYKDIVVSDSIMKKVCETEENNISIPKIINNKEKLKVYTEELKKVEFNGKLLFYETKLEKLNQQINDIFLEGNVSEKNIPTLKQKQIDSLTVLNNELIEKNNKLEKKMNTNLLILLISLIIVAIISLVLFYFLYRMKKKYAEDTKKRIKELEQTKEDSDKDKKITIELNKELLSLKNINQELQTSVNGLNEKLGIANTTITNLIQKQDNKKDQQQKNVNKKQDGFVFSKTFYAQSPGDKYFTRIKNKYRRGNTPYVLRVNEEETEGEFFLYQSEDNYEDALSRHDSVLLFACEIPQSGIDKRTFSKVETPEDGRGKIKKVGEKWEIIKKAKIKLS